MAWRETAQQSQPQGGAGCRSALCGEPGQGCRRLVACGLYSPRQPLNPVKTWAQTQHQDNLKSLLRPRGTLHPRGQIPPGPTCRKCGLFLGGQEPTNPPGFPLSSSTPRRSPFARVRAPQKRWHEEVIPGDWGSPQHTQGSSVLGPPTAHCGVWSWRSGSWVPRQACRWPSCGVGI